ncbi:MAG: hypothetical protein OEV49_05345 [candidate division Zixibacteria bacterium]|nr:hypothetical protein [candidate division Zixibacteria bacterium]MDH3936701.1 hypothetical protein [candidate division Zixibacteria bacterium]MDH4034073.1 hypothetical protein [candidate division Zixibacteria bacterium]
MNENRFTAAGWAAIASVAVFTSAWIVAGIQEAVFELGAWERPVGVGPADFLFLVLAALSIYVYLSFKKLMYEYYSFKEIGLIINITIVWHILFFSGNFLLEWSLDGLWSPNDIGPDLIMTGFWIIGMAVFGIIDIIFGIVLLRRWGEFSSSIKTVAILTLIIGACEVSIILLPATLLLVPAWFIGLAFVFLRRVDEVEFV